MAVSSKKNKKNYETMRTFPINYPVMHCQSEIERDCSYQGLLPDETLMSWFRDSYSTSKHLLTLYSVATGLQARNILEIGFGRSSFVSHEGCR